MFPHIKPPAGTPINLLHPLSQGLVGCLLFNERAGSLSNDLSGNKNHGRLTNMLPNVQGSGWGGSKFGGGLDFDGVDDYVDLVANQGITKGLEVVSVSSWIKLDMLPATGKHTMIFIETNADNGYTKFSITVNDDGSISMSWRDTALGSSFSTSTTTGLISTGVWYYISCTVDTVNDVQYIYIDGVQKKSDTVVSGAIYNDIPALSQFTGRGNDAWVTTEYFNGSIDSVRIYNRALSADEVKILYEDPFCNMMVRRPSGLYVPTVAGLSIPVAMHYYNQMARA